MLEPTGPNAEQIKYWNETAGPRWVATQALIDGQIGPLGRRTMDRAALAAGEHVLDVGCGCGHTTLELATRVGATGSVTGIDLSAIMLAQGRDAATRAGLTHVRFENADAQTHAFTPESCDLVFSRFGIMFFADPTAAFANLRTALRPGGRLAFLCWQPLQDNPWMFVPLAAAAAHLPLPAPPAPDAPGPFAFADRQRVHGILSRAGFVDIAFESLNETISLGGGGSLEKAVDLALQIGPLGAVLRGAQPELRPQVAAAVRAALTPFATPEGVRLQSAAWIVTGRRTG